MRCHNHIIRIAASILAFALLASCSSAPKVSGERPIVDREKLDAAYQIGISDQLQVSVWRNPDLSVAVTVRPDGQISMPLVGDVRAAGETALGLGAKISEELQAYIRNPQVTVIVTNPSSADYQFRVRITGAVNSQLSLPFRDGMTVLDLVLEAGGVTEFANANRTRLYRKQEGRVKVFPVYLDDILKKGQLDTNYELSPSDIVTVPERAF